jgi:nitrogenase molybdenum-iron protein alpha/beta subunit
MTIEYDEKGKFYTDIVKKLPVPVVIQTATHLVRGQVHVREGERLKNELERAEAFLAVTQASVYGEGDRVLYTADFMAIQRAQIVWIMPGGEERQKGVGE